ncbi:hypothetical protein Pan216_18860 [Planctomycetes bacterium Pan216]|uniref:HTH domain protein n=1 Tax=Kolteria novifilia TaxID=2527975 RepID=A0A518B219_9BACT|nr:hypothetical protein Pan216_18860 [Planctomycetes bacterium Pan216]
MRHAKVVRQWTLLTLLSRRRVGVSVREAATELAVGDKTIRRDLAVLLKAGFPITESTGKFNRKRWRISTSEEYPAISLQFDEALALYLGRHSLQPLAGTYFWDATQRAFRKLRASLTDDVVEHLDRLAPRLHHVLPGASDYSDKANLIDDLLVAVEDCRQVLIDYQSLRATEPVTYAVNPLGITFHQGSLYLIAHSLDHKEIRTFKVDRVGSVERTDLPFPRPDDFNLERFYEKTFGVFRGKSEVTVVVRFTGWAARHVIERTWPSCRDIGRRADGSVVATFVVNATEELKTWILGFGANARVSSPANFREDVSNELAAALNGYQTFDDPGDSRTARHRSGKTFGQEP